jgi:uncharacterized membrane protein
MGQPDRETRRFDMTRLQQSIEIGVPVHTAYHQLTQFENYPYFMQDVETVHRTDDTHLHWSTKLSYQIMEWDAEITEQLPDRCIAWRNVSGPTNAGKVELQPVGDEKARVTLTMECEPNDILVAPDGNIEAVMAQRLDQDLARCKAFIEARGAQSGSAPASTSSYAAGSEGWDNTEEAMQPEASSQAQKPQAEHTMQSAPALSQSSDEKADDGQFCVAEEQNFDQQSDQARRVGQMPQDIGALGQGEANPSDAMAKSIQQDKPASEDKARLKQAIERAVPPSE